MRMKQRVLTGIVGALLLLAVFMTFDTIFFNIAVLAAYFIALYEIYSAFKEQNVKALFLLLGIIGAYFILLPYVPQVNNRLVIAFLMGIYALITVASFDRIDFKTLSSSLMFGLYVLVGVASITYLKNILPTAEYGRDGLFLFTMSVVVAWGSDIFAYFGGYLFGKHKLAPNLSPKKTAIAVPVHTPVTGKGTATNTNRLIIIIFFASFSGEPSVFFAISSAFLWKIPSIFSISLLMNLIFFNRLKMGISRKNSATDIIVEPRYAIPAVAKRSMLNSPVPIGIAPFSSMSGNIDTNRVAIILFPKTSSKNLPNASAIIPPKFLSASV